MNIVVLIAPPLAGKGTQAERLAQRTGWAHISTGDLMRERAKVDDEIGRHIKDTFNKGGLVQSNIVDQALEDRLQQDDCKNGVILDGYPREIVQADHLLKTICKPTDRNFRKAVLIDVERKELFNRLAKRGRADDTPEILEKRLKDYDYETLYVAAMFDTEGKLSKVNGNQDIDKVTQDIYRELNI